MTKSLRILELGMNTVFPSKVFMRVFTMVVASILPRSAPTLTVLPTLKGRVGRYGRRTSMMAMMARAPRMIRRKILRLSKPSVISAEVIIMTNRII